MSRDFSWLKHSLMALSLAVFINTANAQKIVFKSNMLSDITGSPHLAFEMKTGNKTTVQVDGMMNLLLFSNNVKFNFLALQPEFRFWNCQPFIKSFWGIHTLFANYNVGVTQNRYNGYLYGAGVSYGYNWYLSRRWNLEFTIGGGVAYLDHDVFQRKRCGEYLGHEKRFVLGVTKLGLNLVYILK